MRRRDVTMALAMAWLVVPSWGWAANGLQPTVPGVQPAVPGIASATPGVTPPGFASPGVGPGLTPPGLNNTLPGHLPGQQTTPFSGPPAYLQSDRSDTLRIDELQVLNLEQKLGSDSPEAHQLKQSLRDAQRNLDQYRLAQSPADARIRKQRLDDSLRSLDMARLRADEAASAQQRTSGQQQK